MTQREKLPCLMRCLSISVHWFRSPYPLFGPTVTNTTFNFHSVDMSDLTKIIQHLPDKYSSGPDGISYIMLKLSLPAIVGPLVRLFNISLRLGEVPEEWKDAVVIPLHKGGKKPSKDPLSYRPITLTSCVARVLEKALELTMQIRKYLEVNKLIYDHQSGFYRSTLQLPNCAALPTNGQWLWIKGSVFKQLSRIWARHTTRCPLQSCFLSSPGVGSLRNLRKKLFFSPPLTS